MRSDLKVNLLGHPLLDAQLNSPGQQTAKTSAFIMLLTLADDQVQQLAGTNPLDFYGSSKGVLRFSKDYIKSTCIRGCQHGRKACSNLKILACVKLDLK